MENRENKWHEDDYASQFCGRGTMPISNQIVFHSALHYLGDVSGKSLLDIACGEGDFCRIIKEKGASLVTGVDISSILLQSAKEQNGDIQYRYGDAFNLEVIDKFDFVTANRIIQFAENLHDLRGLCRGLYNNLKSGGRFVGVTLNIFEEPTWNAHFGIFKPLSPTDDAKRVEVIMPSNMRCVFYYYDPNVYEQMFKDVGFSKFNFQPILIDKSVQQPEGYWDVIEAKPHLVCFVAEK